MLGFGPLGWLALGQLPPSDRPAAVAPGDLVTLTVTIEPGAASGEILGVLAPGSTIPLVVALDAGRASGQSQRPPVIWLPPSQIRNAVAHGALITLNVSVLPGRAFGVVSLPVPVINALAPGTVVHFDVFLLPGEATGDTIEYDNAFLLTAA
jgi:hypothetical protein